MMFMPMIPALKPDVDKILIRFVNSNLCVVNFPKLKNVKKYDNFSESKYHNRTNTLIYNIDAEEMNANRRLSLVEI